MKASLDIECPRCRAPRGRSCVDGHFQASYFGNIYPSHWERLNAAFSTPVLPTSPKSEIEWFHVIAEYTDGTKVETALIRAPRAGESEARASDCEQFGIWIERQPGSVKPTDGDDPF